MTGAGEMRSRHGRRRRNSREDGLAGLWTVWAVGVVVLVTAAVLAWVAAVTARQQAENAADMSALAGAKAHLAGGDGCAAATRVARTMEARVTVCRPGSGSVLVIVAMRTTPEALRALDVEPARARARAGVPP